MCCFFVSMNMQRGPLMDAIALRTLPLPRAPGFIRRVLLVRLVNGSPFVDTAPLKPCSRGQAASSCSARPTVAAPGVCQVGLFGVSSVLGRLVHLVCLGPFSGYLYPVFFIWRSDERRV